MNWIEVRANFETSPPDWSIFIDSFLRHGCENTMQEDAPPTLSSAVVDVEGSGEVIKSLERDLLRLGATNVLSRPLVDENWEENWKRFFHPRKVGARFLIRPTWESADPEGRLEIVLDPGQAFGTGDHPTTRMCLELLEQVFENQKSKIKNPRVADIGCGSGILSIGACLLGAGEVFAVDIEPLSVEVAKENAVLNKVRFEAIWGQGIAAIGEHSPFDLVISNIISAVLIRLAPEIAEAVVQGGNWVVSGIISANWPDVREAAERAGFALDQELAEDDWVGASFIRCKPVNCRML